MDTVKYAAKVAGAVAVFHIIFICLYVFLVSKAQIPTRHVVKTTMDFLPSDVKPTDKQATDFYLATTINEHFVTIKLGFLNCCTLHLTVIGSLLLIFLGGYGLAALPMEYLNSFLNRPQIRDAEDYILTKLILRQKNEEMLAQAKDVKKEKEALNKTIGFIAQRAKKMALQKKINKLKSDYLEHEEVIDSFVQEQNIQDTNPLVNYYYLIMGCMGYLASFIIVFHT